MGATRRVAVIGSGVAGLTAAYVASRTADVTLYEADDRFGGHADTHTVIEAGSGKLLEIDTGFIVHNPRTYPVLLRMFAELGVRTQPSEMSMSIRDDGTGVEWAGALGRKGLFPTSDNLRRPRYLLMLAEIPRFHRRAKALLAAATDSDPASDVTLRTFLREGRFSTYFTRHFMEPMVAAVWSCDPEVALDYPARYLFSFLSHHGMLGIFGSPQWRTVSNGSRSYVTAVTASIAEHGGTLRTGAKVTSVLETGTGVEVTDGNGDVASYDAVVIATHPGHALTMLAEPTALHRELLTSMPYSPNTALLHTDATLMPHAENAWASWNFTRPADAAEGVIVTYDLTRLQRLDTDVHYFVTLGGEHLVDPASVIDRMEYEHPLYNPVSVAAQARLPEISTDRVAFAGAYHGWGFHEDGARSGLAAAERLGLEWPDDLSLVEQRGTSVVETPVGSPGLDTVAAQPARPPASSTQATSLEAPALYATTITHTRRTPFKRSFSSRSRFWVVDIDDLPDHGVLGRFVARDHLGEPNGTIRDNLQDFLAGEGVTLAHGGRVLMAANARALGYNFNPISVFWCFTRAGALEATVVEVHNTYGDRHAYLVHPDANGRASTPKAMYVSPFHGVDGTYELAVPVPGDRLNIAVTLHSSDGRTDDGAVFSAALAGTRIESTGGWRDALRAAPEALRGSLLIRAHGIVLWLRRLPIQPRPTHHQDGVR